MTQIALQFKRGIFIVLRMSSETISVKQEEFCNSGYVQKNYELPSLSLKRRNSQEPPSLSNLQQIKDTFTKFVDSLGELQLAPLRREVFMDCSSTTVQNATCHSMTRGQVLDILCDRHTRTQSKLEGSRLKWRQIEFHAFVWIISKYAEKKGLKDIEAEMTVQRWAELSFFFAGTSWDQCLVKWLSLKKSYLIDGHWSLEEDNVFSSLVGFEGNELTHEDWKYVCAIIYVTCRKANGERIYRTPKQCREHWFSQMDPSIRRVRWEHSEDIILLTCILEAKGEKRWADFMKFLNGRTQNAIKNRFIFLYRKARPKRAHYYHNDLQMYEALIQKKKENIARQLKLEEIKRQKERASRRQARQFEMSSSDMEQPGLKPDLEQEEHEQVIVKQEADCLPFLKEE